MANSKTIAAKSKQEKLDAAALFITFDQFEKAIKSGKAAAKAALGEELNPGDRVAVTLPSGKRIGKVTMTDPKTKNVYSVTDEAAFIAWVSEHYTSAVEFKPVIQPWFMGEGNLEAVIKNNGGEVPPGLTVTEKTGNPYPRAALTVDDRIAFLEAYRAGELSAPVLAEIEGLV